MAQEQPMGLGLLGSQRNIVFKRKYRWTFRLTPYCTRRPIPEAFVKVANRPNLSIEATEINYLHGKMFIPGKATWEEMTVTYYDLGNTQGIGDLYSWLTSVYNFTDPVGLRQSSYKGDSTAAGGYAASAALTLYDGCGTAMEQWNLDGVIPQSINFGELDYSDSAEVTIELTMRYHNCQYVALCGTQFTPCACVGCG